MFLMQYSFLLFLKGFAIKEKVGLCHNYCYTKSGIKTWTKEKSCCNDKSIK